MMSGPIDPETSVLRHPVATQHVAGRGTPLIEERAWEASYPSITLGRTRHDVFSEPHTTP
jgi:hypothetical protein